MKEEELRERFDKRGFGVNKYAKAYGLNSSTLSRVLSGELTGKNDAGGTVRKVIAQLKKDHVYVGQLPWERVS